MHHIKMGNGEGSMVPASCQLRLRQIFQGGASLGYESDQARG